MRILTGRLRGKTIPLTLTQSLRPTQDKVRKAVFDTLQDYTEGKRVLDLYSGTGALGLEALSRGAAFVRFVEHDRTQAARLEKLLQRWGLAPLARVDALDVLRAIDRAGFRKEQYDLVLADPPYLENRGADTLAALAGAGVVKPGGFVIVECGKRETMPEEVQPLKRIRDRRYGQSRLVIYRA
jgi:16S rRNA (guanine966-N2)-methyltransferase